jgi:hypothetical protein
VLGYPLGPVNVVTAVVTEFNVIPNVRVRETVDGLRFDAVIRLDGGRQTTRTLAAQTAEEALEELTELGLLHSAQGLVESICAAVREVVREELERAPVELHDGDSSDDGDQDNGELLGSFELLPGLVIQKPLDEPAREMVEPPFDAVASAANMVGLKPAPPAPVPTPDTARDKRAKAIREAFMRRGAVQR